MPYSFNPFTGNLDKVNRDLTNPIQFKGTINANADFPTSADVENGWFYIINTDVTDNDPSKTNTGLRLTNFWYTPASVSVTGTSLSSFLVDIKAINAS